MNKRLVIFGIVLVIVLALIISVAFRYGKQAGRLSILLEQEKAVKTNPFWEAEEYPTTPLTSKIKLPDGTVKYEERNDGLFYVKGISGESWDLLDGFCPFGTECSHWTVSIPSSTEFFKGNYLKNAYQETSILRQGVKVGDRVEVFFKETRPDLVATKVVVLENRQ